MTDSNSQVSTPIVSDEQLSEIKSFDDALAVINNVFGEGSVVDSGDVLGTGFGVADEKAIFVGVPFIIIRADLHASSDAFNEDGTPKRFWSLHVVTQDGRKAIINDGGSGIAAQLDVLYEKHPEMRGKPMLVRRGLRVSNYVHPVHGQSTTFYLDTSAAV